MSITREDPRFWDVRTMDRRVRKGHVNRKDIEKHLKSLPDVADKAAPLVIGEFDDDDDEDDFESADSSGG